MSQSSKKQILLTNDDGIDSPGLWAAAEALSETGYVTVAAPSEHYSASGRSISRSATGQIKLQKLTVKGQEWDVYSVGGSPAQTVLHAIMEIMPQKPDLVVSGINYGENIGTDITRSGTVGAAFEGASSGIPSLASSVQILQKDWDSYHLDVDFSVAAYFTQYFANLILQKDLPGDVDVLNLSVPVNATPQTPWRITRLARSRYYDPRITRPGSWDEHATLTAQPYIADSLPHDTDVYTLLVDHLVSLTPLSIDMTSRVDLADLNSLLREN